MNAIIKSIRDIRPGDVFGRLTVVRRAESDKHGISRFLCICACGCERVVYGRSLVSGATKSCGCLQRELSIERTRERSTKHGHAPRGKFSPTYRSWAGMLNRCYNPKQENYPRYGGAGISVCDRWRFGEDGLSGFECFLADMGEKPSPQHQIDRIGSAGIYEPSNCRWATREQQANNTSRNVYVEVDGRALTVPQWEREFEWSHKRLRTRIDLVRRILDRCAVNAQPFPFDPPSEIASPNARPDGSYVIPADVVASLGDGNPMAGAVVLKAVFSRKLTQGDPKCRR